MRELQLGEWVIVTPCAGHDAHNAFRWSLQLQFGDRMWLRDCYVAIESLRKSFDQLEGHRAAWVADRLVTREPMDEDWVEEQLILWEVLGLDPETANTLAMDLQYEFKEGKLWISSKAVAEDPDVISTIDSTLKSAWRFVAWPTS